MICQAPTLYQFFSKILVPVFDTVSLIRTVTIPLHHGGAIALEIKQTQTQTHIHTQSHMHNTQIHTLFQKTSEEFIQIVKPNLGLVK